MAYLDDNGEPLNSAPGTKGSPTLSQGVTISPNGGPASGIVPDNPALSANWQKTKNADGSITAAPASAQSAARGDVQTPYGTLSGADADRIDQMLANAQSTDDKAYWYGIAAQHGGVDTTGADWLTGRINQGDGALGVRNGTVQKFQDGGNNPLNPTPFSYPTFTDQFSNPAFQAPTGVDEQNDPGVGARLQLGSRALQQSAAAKGTLLTGQTLSDLNDYAQNFASQEYGNVYNRALQTYDANSANNFQQYQQKYQQYLNGYQQAAQSYGTNLGAGQQAFGDTLALSAQNFGQNQQNWQNQYNLVGQQLNAAQASVNAGSNFANNAGSLYQQGGNAAAAGTVGAANAWTGALGSLANYAQQIPYYSGSPYGASKGGASPGGYSNPYNGYGFSY